MAASHDSAPRGFIVLGDDWGGHPSSVQHLFHRVARARPTLWVNTLGLRPPRLDRRDAERVVRKVRAMLSRPAGGAPAAAATSSDLRLRVVSPPMLPWMRPAPLRMLNRLSVRRAVEVAAAEMRLRDPIVVTTVPNGVDAAGVAGSRRTVYYCVDDFTAWPGVDAAAAQMLERELLDVADAVIATSDNLAKTRRCRYGETALLPHGVDVAHLARASDDDTPPWPGVRNGRPVLGYLGLVDARLDVPLVAAVARLRPEWDIVFVGPTDTAPDPRLRAPNVRFVGAVPYASMPRALAGFDVAVLPYARNELTRSINPLKLREYLASGKPVVATSLPEVMRYSPEVAVADTADEFVDAASRCLEGPRDRREARRAMLAGESWDDRAERFLQLCDPP